MGRTPDQKARKGGRLRSLKVSAGFKSFVLDQLDELGDVTARSMFGGVGLYHRGVFFGIVARDTVYFKVGETNRADYQRAKMKAFRPYPNRSGVMKYHAVPLEVIESAPELATWARKAIAVASRGVLTLLLIAGSSAAVRAQGPVTDRPWEIEVYAGGTMPHAVRSQSARSAVGIIGGGVKQFVTPRWGVRIDLRERIGRNTTVTLLDATPRSGGTGGSAVGSLAFGTTPPLVFSTGTTGLRSNLSGAPISGFKTFEGSGLTLQLNVTAGLIWRF